MPTRKGFNHSQNYSNSILSSNISYSDFFRRIQAEGKQHIVSTGAYGFIRHRVSWSNIAIHRSSINAWIFYTFVAGIVVLFLAGRIIGEEKILLDELEGYADYRKKVRFGFLLFN